MECGCNIQNHLRKFFEPIDNLSEMEIEINPELYHIVEINIVPFILRNFFQKIKKLTQW